MKLDPVVSRGVVTVVEGHPARSCGWTTPIVSGTLIIDELRPETDPWRVFMFVTRRFTIDAKGSMMG